MHLKGALCLIIQIQIQLPESLFYYLSATAAYLDGHPLGFAASAKVPRVPIIPQCCYCTR